MILLDGTIDFGFLNNCEDSTNFKQKFIYFSDQPTII